MYLFKDAYSYTYLGYKREDEEAIILMEALGKSRGSEGGGGDSSARAAGGKTSEGNP